MKKKINLLNQSSFVSASAGSGKTKTLTDRIISLLLQNVHPNKILCLAFTKSAASEIRHRIYSRLSEFTMMDEDNLIKELLNLGFSEINPNLINKARTKYIELLDMGENISIQTIHSFCQQLLLKFPLEAGINLNFTLLSESHENSLIRSAKEILIEDIATYEKAEEAVKYLSWHIKEYSLNELLEEIISNRNDLDQYFDHHITLETAINFIDPEIYNEEEIIEEFISNIPITQQHLEIINLGGKNDQARALTLKNYLQYSEQSKKILINEYLGCYLTAQEEPLKSVLTKKIGEQYPEFHQILLEEQERAYKFNTLMNNLKAINLTKAFIVLSFHLRKIYSELKKNLNSLDYDDLIHLTIKLLYESEHKEWVKYNLYQNIEHVLVDEAQDNSHNQWKIIDLICEEFFSKESDKNSLFIVGDPKQSIFSFQGANPKIFNNKNFSLPLEVDRVKLNISYRSGQNILSFIDQIFNNPQIKESLGEEFINHTAYKNIQSSIELIPLIIDDDENQEQDYSWALPSNFNKISKKTNLEEIVANQIAHKIKEELQEGIIKNPSDVLILTRRRTKLTRLIISSLRNLNIPTSGLDRLKLNEHPVILDLLSLSKFVLNCYDDLNLAILLKSPIFNLDENQLFTLCYNRETTLFERIKAFPEFQHIEKLLTEFIILSRISTPFSFFFTLFEKYNLRKHYEKIYHLEASDVIDSFLDLARNFEAEEIPSLQLFIRFVESSQTEIKKDLSFRNNEVSIMTIHNAKGLQAKTVILTDTTSLPQNFDSIIWLDPTRLLWPGKQRYYPEIAKKARKTKSLKEYAEYIRLLYVALTRAEERLIIYGHSKDEKISPICWYKIIEQAFNNKS